MVDSKQEIKDWLPDRLERFPKSSLMQDILNKVLQLAKLDSNVIIVGEVGSGKKNLAKFIHKHSSQSNGPFHTFYCLDIDENKYREAFWGHLEFDESHLMLKYDLLEKARGGILYLNQFSELSPSIMSKVLISYEKGCNQLYRFNKEDKPRLILSINQESYNKILHASIWENILSKLDPVVIMLPPLRECKEDIPILIQYFLSEIKKNFPNNEDLNISEQALLECFNYDWPGNNLQLKNALLQGSILSLGKTIESHHLPFSISWKLPYQLNDTELLP
jgi:DNA-binding NtrC family response regulator